MTFDLNSIPFRPLNRRLHPDGPLVITNANEGGGTRKTTDGVNTAVELAVEHGLKVAIADCDQTMAASTYLGYGVTNRKFYPARTDAVYQKLAAMPNIYGVVNGQCSLKEAFVPARTRIVPVDVNEDNEAIDDPKIWDKDDCFQEIPNLHLVLGSRDMAVASDDIRKSSNLHWLLKAVRELPAGTIDVLMIDSRGTFDTLEMTELGGSDYVIGCVKPEAKDDDTLHGLKHLISSAQEVFEFSGGAAELRYILLNGHMTNRGKFYVDMFKELQNFYGHIMLPYISENVQVAESVKAQEPVRYYMAGEDPKIVNQFRAVAEVIARDVRMSAA